MRLLILLMLLIAFQPIAWAERVQHVIDGDTFILENEQRVRLAGIDAPELEQPYGSEAKERLSRLILNRDVQLVCEDRKSYGRDICNAFIGHLDVQKELVGWGLAFDYTRFSGGKYFQAEHFAHSRYRGVWSGGVRPWDYRHRKSVHLGYDLQAGRKASTLPVK